MTNEEIFATLKALEGQRIRVNTSSRHEDTFNYLDSVTMTENGSVWIHNEDQGVSLRINPEDFELEVEEVEGTFDQADEAERDATVRRIKFLYGNSGEDDRKLCLCPSCKARRAVREDAKQARLKELGYVAPAPPPAVAPTQTSTNHPAPPPPPIAGRDTPFTDF